MKAATRGLTTRGWGLVAGATGMAGCALLFGIPELYGIAAAAFALVGTARLWVSRRRWNLRVMRAAHPSRVPAGREARVKLSVTNLDSRPSPPVLAADPFDGGKRWARFAIAPLGAGEQRTASYRLPTSQRGVFRLGPLELEAVDPFGIARTTQDGGPDATVTVHPAFEALPLHMLASVSELDSSEPVPTVGRGGNEFFSLRPYDPGDDLRRVHWPSSARVDDLVVRQPDTRRQTRMTVYIDLRVRVHDSVSLEAVLSAGASIALSGLSEGLQVRVATSGGLDTGFNAGAGEGPIVLDALASAERHPGSHLPTGWRLPPGRDPVILITTDGARDEEISGVLGRLPSTNRRVIVFERRPVGGEHPERLGASFARSGASGVRHPTLRITVGGSLRKAWEVGQW